MKKQAISMAVSTLFLGSAVPLTFSTAAQAAEPGADTGGIEEVVVTARRVEEKLQDVPLAITAFSGEQLEKAGVETMSDVSKTVPSVQMSAPTGRKQSAIFGIRGQRADDVLLTQDQAVGVYINGVAQGWAYGLGQAGILDIASFEVAKGPQGTLFGKNTTGGAIIITPNKPKDEFDASAKFGYGNYGAMTGEGMVNLPMGNTLAARLAVGYSKSDGTVDNLDIGEDFSGDDSKAVRLSLQWRPSDELTSLLVFDGFDSDTNSGVPVKLTAVNPASPLDQQVGAALGVPGFSGYAGYYAAGLAQQESDDFFSSHTDEDQFMKTRTWGFGNTTTYEASPALTVKNIASVSRLEVDGLVDLDGVNGNAIPIAGSFPTGHPFAGVPYAAVLSNKFSSRQITEAQQVTEELQLIGKTDRVDWIGGVYYSLLDGKDYSFANQFSSVQTIAGSEGGFTNESMAIFGQGTVHLTDTLNLTTGLRYTRDQREIISTARAVMATPQQPNPCNMTDPAYVSPTNPAGRLPEDACSIQSNDSFGEPTWNVSLDWKVTPDHLLYAAHRRGYRAGALSGRGTSKASLQGANPENVDDFEIGSKNDFRFGGQALRLNAAVFYQDYQDVQRNQTFLEDGLVKTTVVNAASATLKGGEIELTYLPLDSLELMASVSYIDAAYDEWDVENPAAPGTTVDRSANTFAAVPKRSGSFTARYTLPLPSQVGDVSVSGNVYAQSGTSLYVDNATDGFGLECKGGTQGGYELYNARLDWANVMGSKNWSASVWGKNLTNEEYYSSGLCLYNQAGFSVAYPGDPTTYGVTIGYQFGG